MKHAQIKMFETIAILIIFFFLVTFGFIFYAKIEKVNQKAELAEKTVENAVRIAQEVYHLPELQYTEYNDPKGAIDQLKLQKAENIFEQRKEYYFNSLGYVNISIEYIYPNHYTRILYDFPKNDSELIPTPLPILIRDPISGNNTFAILHVGVYI